MEIAHSVSSAVHNVAGVKTTIKRGQKSSGSASGTLAADLLSRLRSAGDGLSKNDDAGTATAGVVISGGVASAAPTVRALKTAEKAGVRAVKGGYEVATTAGLTVITIGKTASVLRSSSKVAGVAKAGLLKTFAAQAGKTGLSQKIISRHLIHAVQGVQTKAGKAAGTIRTVRGAIRGGTLSVVAAHGVKKVLKKGVKKGGGVLKGTVRGMAVKGGKLVKTGIKKGGLSAVNALQNSEDWSVSSLGTAINSGMTAAKAGKAGAKGIRTGIKTGVKTVKHTKDAVKTGIKVAKKTGEAARKTAKTAAKAAQQAAQAAQQALQAAQQAIAAAAQAAAQAAAAAAQAIAAAAQALASAIITGISAAVAAGWPIIVALLIVLVIAILFGGFFSVSDDGEEETFEISAYIEERMPDMLSQFEEDLTEELEEAEGRYDIVRFNGSSDFSAEDIEAVMPSSSDLASMLSPLYNVIVLMEYDLEPTQEEAEELLTYMFDQIFEVSHTYSKEYCAEEVCEECGKYHAADDCLNLKTGTHSEYTCSVCDSWSCPGHASSEPVCGKEKHLHRSSCYEKKLTCAKDHEHTSKCYEDVLICEKEEHRHNAWKSALKYGCYATVYCDNPETCENKMVQCSGYAYCKGHSVETYYLNSTGIYSLVNEYFTIPINDLSAINPRTDEQEEELQNIKDYYEIFEQLMEESGMSDLLNYRGSYTMSDLGNVQWVNGSRKGNQDVVDLALSQMGYEGGKIYWSYYGYTNRVAWCAIFVHWCMDHTPSAAPYYPKSANYALCQTMVETFKKAGQWADRNFIDLIPGDVIFYDWNGDGNAQHTGIVIGTDGETVYVVEGNKSDAVGTRAVSVGASSILGYGLMNYG